MNLIVTRADNKIKEICGITHPILKNYAKKCNADFKIITCNQSPPESHYRIMQCYELLNKYDRIVVLDSDMLVLKFCPNLFNIVPEDKIGVIYEDVGSRKQDRQERIQKVQNIKSNIGWKSGYINTGCFVISKMHQNIFVQEDLYNDLGYDDVELGYQINKNKFSIFELPYSFNFMSMFTEDWCNMFKSDAFILHYAGNGFNRVEKRLTQIKNDFNILKRYNMI